MSLSHSRSHSRTVFPLSLSLSRTIFPLLKLICLSLTLALTLALSSLSSPISILFDLFTLRSVSLSLALRLYTHHVYIYICFDFLFIFLVVDVEVIAIFQTPVSRWLQTGSSKNSSISRSSNNSGYRLRGGVKSLPNLPA
ncbi:unnamed protein product [Camellia sinensis]